MSIQEYKNEPHRIIVRNKLDKGTAKLRILHRVMNSPLGATCDELEIRLGLSHQTASAAITEMAKSGMIVDSGERRHTRSGRKARVYVRRKLRK